MISCIEFLLFLTACRPGFSPSGIGSQWGLFAFFCLCARRRRPPQTGTRAYAWLRPTQTALLVRKKRAIALPPCYAVLVLALVNAGGLWCFNNNLRRWNVRRAALTRQGVAMPSLRRRHCGSKCKGGALRAPRRPCALWAAFGAGPASHRRCPCRPGKARPRRTAGDSARRGAPGKAPRHAPPGGAVWRARWSTSGPLRLQLRREAAGVAPRLATFSEEEAD